MNTIIKDSTQIGKTYRNLHTGRKARIIQVEKIPEEALGRDNPDKLTTMLCVLDDDSRWNMGPFFLHWERVN